jgi:hypothetical protein
LIKSQESTWKAGEKEEPVLTQIQQLVAEEHHLFDKGSLDEAESQRLVNIQDQTRSVLGPAATAPRAA